MDSWFLVSLKIISIWQHDNPHSLLITSLHLQAFCYKVCIHERGVHCLLNVQECLEKSLRAPKQVLELDPLCGHLHVHNTLVLLFFIIEKCNMPVRMASCNHHADVVTKHGGQEVWHVRTAWERSPGIEPEWSILMKGEEVNYSHGFSVS